eukprot:2056859-Prorocentrum_lima.AAC.1
MNTPDEDEEEHMPGLVVRVPERERPRSSDDELRVCGRPRHLLRKYERDHCLETQGWHLEEPRFSPGS